jgi:hypothetical protein
MLRLILFLALLAILAPLLIDGGSLDALGGNPLGPTLDGSQLVIQTDDLEARFDRVGTLDESYMLFGGTDGELQNSISNLFVSGLAVRHASLISKRYPDFYKCKSPGAAQAQRMIESMAWIASDGSTRGTLRKALDLHEKSLRSGGERTCLAVSGERLILGSVKHRGQGFDLTHQVGNGFRGTDFYLVTEAELADCKSLL